MIPDCQRRLQQAHAELTALLVRYAVYDYGESHSILAMVESPTGLTNNSLYSWHQLLPVSGSSLMGLACKICRPPS